MRYDKPFLTFEQQLQLMKRRGLFVANDEAALERLAHIGYYRISGYIFQWRIVSEEDGIREERFETGRSFEDAIALYAFDRQLRLLLLDAIERIEVALKVQIAYSIGKHGPLAYLDQTFFSDVSSHSRPGATENNFDHLIRRSTELLDASSETYARHMREHYDSKPPIWIAVELWDLGLLCHIYEIMRTADRIEVSTALQTPTYRMLTSWMGSIRHVRNICAHHSRLYRRHLTHRIGLRDTRRADNLRHLLHLPEIHQHKLYPTLAIVAYLMRAVAPHSHWRSDLIPLLENFPIITHASLADYGFPDNWRDEDLWQ